MTAVQFQNMSGAARFEHQRIASPNSGACRSSTSTISDRYSPTKIGNCTNAGRQPPTDCSCACETAPAGPWSSSPVSLLYFSLMPLDLGLQLLHLLGVERLPAAEREHAAAHQHGEHDDRDAVVAHDVIEGVQDAPASAWPRCRTSRSRPGRRGVASRRAIVGQQRRAFGPGEDLQVVLERLAAGRQVGLATLSSRNDTLVNGVRVLSGWCRRGSGVTSRKQHVVGSGPCCGSMSADEVDAVDRDVVERTVGRTCLLEIRGGRSRRR